ncbi:phage tail protein [Salmonella enterica]|uniref:phage tail protein n=1 Tax=Salmonella enterica TaxID=28901 RepID=UPI001E306F96|nr:phage tail protein [Salmonella enterica]
MGNILSCVNGKWSVVSNLPVGSPVPWPSNTAPVGWLICRGQSFNTALYPQLAKAYPRGRLPDLRGVIAKSPWLVCFPKT